MSRKEIESLRKELGELADEIQECLVILKVLLIKFDKLASCQNSIQN